MIGLLAQAGGGGSGNGYIITILLASIAAFGAGGAALIRSFTVDRRTAKRDDIDALWEENRLLRQENEGIRVTNRQLNDQLFKLQGELAIANTKSAEQQWAIDELKRKLGEHGISHE